MTETLRDFSEESSGRQTLMSVLHRLVRPAKEPAEIDIYAGAKTIVSPDIKSPEELTAWCEENGIEPDFEPVV